MNILLSHRKHARKYTIVVTDGQCSEPYLSSLYINAAALRSNSASGRAERQVWSIGVGEADVQELIRISGDQNKVLRIDNFKRIDEIKGVRGGG